MSFDVDPSAARGRQQRLLVEMRKLDLDLVIVARTEHVQWITGPRFGWVYEPLAALWKDGSCTLVAPNEPPKVHGADAVVTYEAQWNCTLRNDQRQASVANFIGGTTWQFDWLTKGRSRHAFSPPAMACSILRSSGFGL